MAERAAEEVAERELEKARESLADARTLREADGSVHGVINRRSRPSASGSYGRRSLP